ncbi:MAG: 50S ribosomal protein L15 [Spirochaetes bacterium]|nr:50S ribosomal protein L15 [Spirochaetota bacterium]
MEENYSLNRPESSKSRKRVGRGPSSGHGKTSCRGQKGQLSRSGAKKRVWFEGGQMPLQRRIPKRGFNNNFKKSFQIINLSNLINIGVSEVTPEVLVENKVIQKADKLVKVLGKGELSKPVTITADAFSATAVKGIESAGGKVIIRESINKSQMNSDNPEKA